MVQVISATRFGSLGALGRKRLLGSATLAATCAMSVPTLVQAQAVGQNANAVGLPAALSNTGSQASQNGGDTTQSGQANQNSSAPSLPSSNPGLGEIVVTAQRRNENLQHVPITVQAISAAEIRDAGVRTPRDIAQLVPNVEVGLPGGAGAQPIITIRGIGLNDGNTNNPGPNGVYTDEVYIAAPVAQSLQIFDLQQIEVLKGPQGTLYGRNASGGAVNFITNKPSDTLTGDLLTSYGSFNTFNIEGAVGGPLAAGLDGRVAFTTTRSDGYIHNDLYNRDENGEKSFAGRAELRWEPTSDLTILANVHGAHQDQRPAEYRHIGTLNVEGRLCTVAQARGGECADLLGFGTPAGFYGGSFNRSEHLRVDDIGGYLRADYRFSDVTLTSITSYAYNRSFRPEDTDASPNRLVEVDYGVKSRAVTQELRVSQTASRYNWVLGAYFLREDLHQDQPLYIFLDADKLFGLGAGDGLAEIASDRARQITRSLAIFGQGDYHLTDKLTATLGGRYSDEIKTFLYNSSYQFQQGGAGNYAPPTILPTFASRLHNDAFNYRAALNYELLPDIRAYVSAASGFKSGGFNGGFLSSVPVEIEAQLRPVKPEHVTSFEGGIKAEFLDHRIRLNVAAFYNRYRDIQVFTLVPSPVQNNPPLNLLDNAPKAHTGGIDLSLVARVTSSLQLTENFGWVDTRLDRYVVTRDPSTPDYSGNRLALSSKFSSSTILDYSIPLGSGTAKAQLMASYKSKQYFDTSNDPYTTQPGYVIGNVRISYAFRNGLELAFYVRNLADKHYLVDSFDLSSPFGLLEDVVGTPRTFGGELNYRF